MTTPRKLRAPQAHGTVLAEPPLDNVESVLARNRELFQHTTFTLLGKRLGDLQREARSFAVSAACGYHVALHEPFPVRTPLSTATLANQSVNPSLILAGHQPELFHPGVWIKSFALNGLARRFHALPVNLVIDSDTIRHTAMKLPDWAGPNRPPSCDPASVASRMLPFDRWSREAPYEERAVLDEEIFASLSRRAEPYLGKWPFHPMLGAFWQEVVRAKEKTNRLGERLATGRRVFERKWGCHNLEAPMSRICQSESFLWFVATLLADLRRFHSIYNEAVRDYRRIHGLKSQLHPVPALQVFGDWWETPLWAWREHGTARERLFAQLQPGAVTLRFGDVVGPSLHLSIDADPASAIADLREWQSRGFKIRSRALVTTLYARMVLGDLFIHGIGGAKYDEITDQIIARFFEMEPPGYIVLSATLQLPFVRFEETPLDEQRTMRLRRDLFWNPERTSALLPDDARAWSEQKALWIARPALSKSAARTRFGALRELTAKLRGCVADRAQAAEKELENVRAALNANALLGRRDYPFCLYPEEELRRFLGRFL